MELLAWWVLSQQLPSDEALFTDSRRVQGTGKLYVVNMLVSSSDKTP